MTGPRTSIVVIPRERFSAALRSLDSLIEQTPGPFELVYVDAGSPAPVRAGIAARLAGRLDTTLIRVDGFLPTNRSRNLGFRACRGEYVVFTDNDVVFSPGWLPPLIQAADETGAAAVGPLICERDPVHTFLHDAGVTVTITEQDGERLFDEHHQFTEYRWQGRSFADVRGQLRRSPCDVIEFHCMLVRRTALAERGGLDEGMISMWEHTDTCLSLKEAGGTVWVEPASVVTFLRPPPVAWMDLPWFFVRWCDDWARASDANLARKWGRYQRTSLPFIAEYREETFKAPLARLQGIAGWRLSRWAFELSGRGLEWLGRHRLAAPGQP